MNSKLFEGARHSKNYAIYRPIPPDSLIKTVVSFLRKEQVRRTDTAVDVGCGSGQSTAVLSPYFPSVTGLDVSKTQIEEAKAQLHRSGWSNIDFRVQSAEHLPFENGTVDLVTICQAIHWLKVEDFYAEANRVLSPGGVLAVYGYHLTGPSPGQEYSQELENIRNWIFDDVLGKYWNPERRIVDAGYKTLPPMHYKDFVRDESHLVEIQGNLADFAGYVETWSAFQNFKKERGDDESEKLISTFIEKCKTALGTSKTPNEIPLALRTNYFLLMGRKPK